MGRTGSKVRAAALLLLLAAPGAGSAAVAATDCAQPQTQADLNECAGRQADAADAGLNAVYRAVTARLGDPGRVRLRDAQRAWLVFRERECAFQSGGRDGGSAASMVAASCYAALTAARTRALGVYRRCPEGDLSCPG